MFHPAGKYLWHQGKSSRDTVQRHRLWGLYNGSGEWVQSCGSAGDPVQLPGSVRYAGSRLLAGGLGRERCPCSRVEQGREYGHAQWAGERGPAAVRYPVKVRGQADAGAECWLYKASADDHPALCREAEGGGGQPYAGGFPDGAAEPGVTGSDKCSQLEGGQWDSGDLSGQQSAAGVCAAFAWSEG